MKEKKKPKILLVGWDAADWKIIDPLLAEGKMPFLQSLIDNGVRGNLATIQPILSPMLWTSIATGKRPFKHGIYGFTEAKPDRSGIRPVSSLSRKTKAIWNILHQSELRSNVVGWWPSHPAEPIDGTMISNHFHRASKPIEEDWPVAPCTIHPEKLANELASLRYHPSELKAEELLPFVPRAAEIDQEKDERLASCAKILAEATTIQAAATYLIENESWDFTAVYFDAIDHWCHSFMSFHPPKLDHISDEDFDKYHRVINTGYIYHDMMLRNLVTMAGEDTIVMLISDHGFHPDHLRPKKLPNEPAGPAMEHREFGIFVCSGPGVKKGNQVYGASILDITPTLLTMFALPVGNDFDGKPLLDIFEVTPKVEQIDSWDEINGDSGSHPVSYHTQEEDSREVLNQLIDLGYIDKPPENIDEAIRQTERELEYNRARSLMDDDYYADAALILEELVTNDPDEYRFGIQLAFCYRSLNKIVELKQLAELLNKRKVSEIFQARNQLKKWNESLNNLKSNSKNIRDILSPEDYKKYRELQELSRINPYTLQYLLAYAEIQLKNFENALKLLKEAEKTASTSISIHLMIGEAYLQVKEWQRAEERFDHTLKLDPDHPIAHLGICRAFLPRKRNFEAAASALQSIKLKFHYPMAHYYLGIAYHRLGRIHEAVNSIETALEQNPNFEEAHKRLVLIYERTLKNKLKAQLHRKSALQIKKLNRQEREKIRKEKSPNRDAIYAALEKAPDFKMKFPDTLLPNPNHNPDPNPNPNPNEKQKAFNLTPDGKKVSSTEKREFPKEPIIIITGLPRSGTSLMMQFLETSSIPLLTDEKRKSDEDNPKGYYEFEPVKRLQYENKWLLDATGKCVKIVTPLIQYLVNGFNYKFIFMERNLDEVVKSQKIMLNRKGKRSVVLPDNELVQIYQKQLDDLKYFLNMSKAKVIYIQFKDCLHNSEIVLDDLNKFLGTSLNSESINKIIDHRLYRQKIT